jgi:hypothetical protein
MSTRLAVARQASLAAPGTPLPAVPDLPNAPPAGPATRRTLPSGRSVVVHRPRGFGARWDMAGSGGLFQVRRLRHGNSAEYEYAKDAAGRPLELTEEDAHALAAMLNDLLHEASDRAEARRTTRTRRAG